MKEHNFIEKGFIKSSTCESLIKLYEKSPLKEAGTVGEGNQNVVHKSMKDNTEIFILFTYV